MASLCAWILTLWLLDDGLSHSASPSHVKPPPPPSRSRESWLPRRTFSTIVIASENP